jgi:hypothetical protein
MARYGVSAGALILALFLAGAAPPSASAQMADEVLHQFQVQPWFARGSGPAGTWSSTLWRLSYRRVSAGSPVGLGIGYVLGGAMGETFLTLDASYRLPLGVFREGLVTRQGVAAQAPVDRGFGARAIARYGSFSFNIAGGRATSTGLGVGTEWTVLLPQQPSGGRLAIVADYVTYFGNTTTAPLGTGPGRASTYSIALVFKPARRSPEGSASGWRYASTLTSSDLLGAEWSFSAGATGSSIEIAAGSTYTWTGFFIGVSKTF